MPRPMPNTMGPGFALDLPFTRSPQERAVENLERKRKQEEAIKQKIGEFGRAVTGTKVARFAGDIAGSAGGAALGTKGGAMAGGTIGAAVGGPVGAIVGAPIGAAVGGVAGGVAGGALGRSVAGGLGEMREKGIGKDIVRTAFGGGAITGDMEGRRSPTEDVVVGNPMASPFAADSVKMPQDLQLGYVHMNRFGSPLPIHGLATPGRTSAAGMMQDQNFIAYQNAIMGGRK